MEHVTMMADTKQGMFFVFFTDKDGNDSDLRAKGDAIKRIKGVHRVSLERSTLYIELDASTWQTKPNLSSTMTSVASRFGRILYDNGATCSLSQLISTAYSTWT